MLNVVNQYFLFLNISFLHKKNAIETNTTLLKHSRKYYMYTVLAQLVRVARLDARFEMHVSKVKGRLGNIGIVVAMNANKVNPENLVAVR